MPAVALLYAVLMVIASVGSVCGNGVLVLVVALNSSLRTETWVLTLSFCLCDLSLGLSIIPIGVHNSLFQTQDDAASSGDGTLCQTSAFIFVLLQLASVNSLALATVDKFAEICFALHYARLCTRRRTWAALALLWVYCLFGATCPLLGFGEYRYSQTKFLCTPSFQPSHRGFSVVLLAMGIIAPILVMCSLCTYVIYIARNQALRGTFVCNEQHCYYVPANNYFRSSIVMVATVVCLLVTWLPYITTCFYETFTGRTITPAADAVATWLMLFTSALNPWINSMTQKKYRAALQGSLKKLRHRFQLPIKSSIPQDRRCSITTRSRNSLPGNISHTCSTEHPPELSQGDLSNQANQVPTRPGHPTDLC
ncbi:hypothetical protein AGOR_G00108450 [Albula goreensis]|uniref:G-protein coupled receptors family 1 profile domain-containing protein n=1 Tax=Albula goreensis TaxID=1534307 RepID=A0A8T3DII2_9TELE|nr:hypothetical protein AGOR_G00108450 [Albula goreensis]